MTGCTLSKELEIAKAKMPPILVPPITSKILCKGYPTSFAKYYNSVAKRRPLIPPPSRLRPSL